MEMMITIAIIGILAAVAYPSYDEYVKRGKRSEGQALLGDSATAQERYYSQNFSYITATGDLSKLKTKITSNAGLYDLEVSSVADDGGYTLTAKPSFSDTDCGDLTLNALGERGRTGSGKTIEECWR